MKVYCFVSTLIIAGLLLSTFSACSPLPDEENYDPSYLDTIPRLVSHVTLDGGAAVDIDGLHVYDDKVLLFIDARDASFKGIKALDKFTGKEVWTWSDAYDMHGVRGYHMNGSSESYLIHKGSMVVSFSNLIHIIDLQSGIAKERYLHPTNLSVGYGVDQALAATTRISDYETDVLLFDLVDFSYKHIGKHVSKAPYLASVSPPAAFFHEERLLVAYVSQDVLPGSLVSHSWLNLYDVDAEETVWRSDTIPLPSIGGSMGNRIRYDNGMLILANHRLYAYDVTDGSLAWLLDYDSSLQGNHPIIVGGRIYANLDKGEMICVNVRNGRPAWQEPTGGSPSPTVYNDGRVYMSNVTQQGGNSLLVRHAINGELLYDVVAPYDPAVDRFPLFNDAIAVDPETGYVYTGNYRDLLVYDFP